MEFINYLLHLKGVPTEDASWPENLENVQIFALQTSYVFSVNMYVAEVLLFFFLRIVASQGAAMLVPSFQQRQKMVCS